MSLYALIKPFLYSMDPEKSHGLAIKALKLGAVPPCSFQDYPSLQTELFGLSFPSPVGMAAGFDKNGEVYAPLLKTGFGFVEVGTVTPKPQIGNPKPRIFRLTEDKAVINRLGFNNRGMDAMKSELEHRRKEGGIVGVNIGRNKDTRYAVQDYTLLLGELGALADYITINISSPNTEGLRGLQQREMLENLLAPLMEVREKLDRHVPLLLKIAPDMKDDELKDVAEVAGESGLDGLIVTNTTISRPATLRSKHREQLGGLSGEPLRTLATETLRTMYRLTEGKIPLVGVGGISSGQDAIARIRAGASLVQLYTALVYQGFGLVSDIKRELADHLEQQGMTSINQLIGADA